MNKTSNVDHGMMSHGDMAGKEKAMDMGSMSMQMTFNHRLPLSLLFEDVKLHNATDLATACILLFMLGGVYEFVKFLRLQGSESYNFLSCCHCSKTPPPNKSSSSSLNSRSDLEMNCHKRIVASAEDCISIKDSKKTEPDKSKKVPSVLSHWVATSLHALQLCLSYVIMLAVMTYNVFIVLSIITGSTLGYLLFHWPTNRKKLTNRRRRQQLLQQDDCH